MGKVKPCNEVHYGKDLAITTPIIRGYGSCSNGCPPVVADGNFGVSKSLIFQEIPFNLNGPVGISGFTSKVYKFGSLIDLRLHFTVADTAYNTVITLGSIGAAYVPTENIALAITTDTLTTGDIGSQAILLSGNGSVQFETTGGNGSVGISIHGTYLSGGPITCSTCQPCGGCSCGCSGGGYGGGCSGGGYGGGCGC